MVKSGCGQSSYETLNKNVQMKSIDFLHAGANSKRKTKSYFNDFWVGIVKNGMVIQFMRLENMQYHKGEFVN